MTVNLQGSTHFHHGKYQLWQSCVIVEAPPPCALKPSDEWIDLFCRHIQSAVSTVHIYYKTHTYIAYLPPL
jgi:hypothetical protein